MKYLFITLSIISISLLNLQAQVATPLYTIAPQQDSLWTVDTSSYSEIGAAVQLTSSTGTISGCNGFSERPCTGELFIVYKAAGSRYLGIVDPENGVVTPIGDMGDNVAGICFGTQNQLYAVTGDGATNPNILYKVNISNASMTTFATLGNGDDGESIAFNFDNGMIYHWSGLGTKVMESIDTASGLVTNIPLSGFDMEEVFGSTYYGNNTFMINNINSEYILVDIAGLAVTTGLFAVDDLKGLILPSAYIETSDSSFICANDSATFTSIAATTYQWLLNGAPIPGANGPTYTTSTGGNYQCQVTHGACSYLSDTLSLATMNIPNVSLNPSPTAYICSIGDSVLLTGSSGGSSQWYMNGTTITGETNNTLWALTIGNYNMVKTNQNGCSDSSSVGIEVTLPPALSLTPNDTIIYCINDSSLLNATPGATSYLWYLNGVLISGSITDSLYVSTVGTYTVSAMFGLCSDSTLTGVIAEEDSCQVSVNNIIFVENISVYPNPAKDQLNIDFSLLSKDPISIKFSTIDGKIIMSDYRKNMLHYSIRYNVSNLSPGMYFLKMNQGEHQFIRRFIIK